MPENTVCREYVLVHGAWHGAWCWELLVPELEALGHKVITPNLPGRGNDKTPAHRITLTHYVAAIEKAVAACSDKPVVVGHSMAGIVITQLAENIPDRLAALVYLSAFVPRDGESLAELAAKDSESLVSRHRIVDEEHAVMSVPEEIVRDAFYGECTAELADRAIARLSPTEPLLPSATPVNTSMARFGSVPRTFIECTHDRAITLPLQRMMYNNTACPQQMTLASDHSPFYSKPLELAACLNRVDVPT